MLFQACLAQDRTNDTQNLPYFVIDGDTIPKCYTFKEVVVFKPLRFPTYDAAKRYAILRYRTLKVYPYANWLPIG